MRPIHELGVAPLPAKDIQDMLVKHIPYRVQLHVDGGKVIPAKVWADNSTFEAGAISGRTLLSFLGIGLDRKNDCLKTDCRHDELRKKSPSGQTLTDDVKIRDVGGRFVDPETLSPEDRVVLVSFIHGVHKACAHFTMDSQHKLSAPIYHKAQEIILRLLREHLPKRG